MQKSKKTNNQIIGAYIPEGVEVYSIETEDPALDHLIEQEIKLEEKSVEVAEKMVDRPYRITLYGHKTETSSSDTAKSHNLEWRVVMTDGYMSCRDISPEGKIGKSHSMMRGGVTQMPASKLEIDCIWSFLRRHNKYCQAWYNYYSEQYEVAEGSQEYNRLEIKKKAVYRAYYLWGAEKLAPFMNAKAEEQKYWGHRVPAIYDGAKLYPLSLKVERQEGKNWVVDTQLSKTCPQLIQALARVEKHNQELVEKKRDSQDNLYNEQKYLERASKRSGIKPMTDAEFFGGGVAEEVHFSDTDEDGKPYEERANEEMAIDDLPEME